MAIAASTALPPLSNIALATSAAYGSGIAMAAWAVCGAGSPVCADSLPANRHAQSRCRRAERLVKVKMEVIYKVSADRQRSHRKVEPVKTWIPTSGLGTPRVWHIRVALMVNFTGDPGKSETRRAKYFAATDLFAFARTPPYSCRRDAA